MPSNYLRHRQYLPIQSNWLLQTIKHLHLPIFSSRMVIPLWHVKETKTRSFSSGPISSVGCRIGNNKMEHKSLFIAFRNGSLITRGEEDGELIPLSSASQCVSAT